ncbi:MAG: hypothetical protein IPK79_10995 [Vampirovibrionales bacterium]|nr:hypothetical protein [Vampirovibrionales bacterium]
MDVSNVRTFAANGFIVQRSDPGGGERSTYRLYCPGGETPGARSQVPFDTPTEFTRDEWTRAAKEGVTNFGKNDAIDFAGLTKAWGSPVTAALVMWNNDKNFDGKISLEERQQRFNELDVNHDNKLDLSEQMQDLNLSMPLWMGEPSVRNNHFNGFF